MTDQTFPKQQYTSIETAELDCLHARIAELEARFAMKRLLRAQSGPVPDYTGEGSAWVPPVEARAVVVPELPTWENAKVDYDRSIHSNRDAKAWADLFVATYPGLADKHDIMLGWFANSMMAMHDSLKQEAPAVVVPELTEEALVRAGGPYCINDREPFQRGARWAVEFVREHSRAIPDDRVLGKGMVAVDREQWAATQDLLAQARCAAHAVEDDGQCDMTGICRAVFACDSLRANQGGDDHGNV